MQKKKLNYYKKSYEETPKCNLDIMVSAKSSKILKLKKSRGAALYPPSGTYYCMIILFSISIKADNNTTGYM